MVKGFPFRIPAKISNKVQLTSRAEEADVDEPQSIFLCGACACPTVDTSDSNDGCMSFMPTSFRCLSISLPAEDDEIRSPPQKTSNSETTSSRNLFLNGLPLFNFKTTKVKNQRSGTLMDENNCSSDEEDEERGNCECTSEGEDQQEGNRLRSNLPFNIKPPKSLNPWSVVKSMSNIKNKVPKFKKDGLRISPKDEVFSSDFEEEEDQTLGRDDWEGGDKDDSVLFSRLESNKPGLTVNVGPSLPISDVNDSEIISARGNRDVREKYFAPRRANDALLGAANKLHIKKKMLWTNTK